MMTEDEKERYEIYLKNREILSKIKEKSEDDYEKNLVLITSGTLVLSMTFIEKIAPLDHARAVWWIIVCWGLLAISLLGNLYSHMVSTRHSVKYMNDHDDGVDEKVINKNVRNNNKEIIRINNWTMGFMISGIICLVVYCSINVYHMSQDNKEKDLQTRPLEDFEKKGRTIETLIVPKPQQAPPPPPPKDPKK